MPLSPKPPGTNTASVFDKTFFTFFGDRVSARTKLIFTLVLCFMPACSKALEHAGIKHKTKVNINFVLAETLSPKNVKKVLSKTDAVLVPGGFGDRGIEGMILACKYARENQIPYLGICLGMQVAMIEYARNVLKLKGANSTEFDSKTKHPIIALITEWNDISGKKEQRDKNSDLGGRLDQNFYLFALFYQRYHSILLLVQ